MQATDHGDTEKSFLYWIYEFDQTKLLCDPIMILQTTITYKRIRHSPLFPKELLFSLFVNWGLNEKLTHIPLWLFLSLLSLYF